MIDKINAWLILEKLEKHEMLAHLYGITETDALAYFHILGENTLNLQEIAEKLNKDRTTAQKTVKKLVEHNLVHRRKINLAKGGIKFNYEAMPFYLVKDKMLEKLDMWHSTAQNKINTL